MPARLVFTLVLAAGLLSGNSPARARRAPPPPRTPAHLLQVMADSPHGGECASCHTLHGSDLPTPQEHALTGPDDNTFCDHCHTTPWAGGSYAGTRSYDGSAHGSGSATIWPGPYPPPRTEADAPGKCLNCHDPHGWEDADGMIPRLTIGREEVLCLTCHDGAHATTDIRTDLNKVFAHPTRTYKSRHAGPLESNPADFAITPLNHRHAECEDCHNPHVARPTGALVPPPPAASTLLLGTSRIAVQNGPAGTAPGYTFVAASDTLTAPVAEYQLCFKCHSSWTTQPASQTDLAKVLNPANPSFHPVEAPGTNANIAAGAFAGGWNAGSMVRCGNCHGSDPGGSAGPHGSVYAGILPKPYAASPATHTTTSDELCFSCHTFEVYADPTAPDPVRGASRFNAPGALRGHAEHVGQLSIPCYACHTTHGSSTLPHLLVTGRSPGIISYSESPTGGTCTATCHAAKTYATNYAR
ncbi:MAG TPA: cytochrome c3 family protein [Candidatus Eisenbacteria bacterium]|jgi:predicted CXXCH cytochrome family protein